MTEVHSSVTGPASDETRQGAHSPTVVLPSHSDAVFITQVFGQKLQQAIPSIDHLLALFHPDAYFRDMLALQWDHRTLHGHDNIRHFLADGNKLGTQDDLAIRNIQIEEGRDAVSAMPAPGATIWITALFRFETPIGRGRGAFRLAPDPSAPTDDLNGSIDAWKAVTMFTALEELNAHHWPLAPEHRPNGIVHKPVKQRLTWLERRQREVEFQDGQPAVVIVGAGQAGLALAAHLKMLDIPTLVLEKHERVGDSWRKRFRQLTLHDPVTYNQMPFIPFPSFWPRFTPKDKLAEFFESYAKLLELNVWTGATLESTTFDDAKSEWALKVKHSDGQARELRPRFLVQATGHSGEPNIPTFKGWENFKGTVMHSSEFTAGTDYKGKSAVVVGACNSGHDIAQDFWESDAASITLVQRSSTYIVSINSVCDILFGQLYNEDRPSNPCPSTEDCDILYQSAPTMVLKEIGKITAQMSKENDRELLEGLGKAGFQVDYGPDGSGFLLKYLTKGGGYYLDVGASGLIAKGEIKVKQGQNISHFSERGLVFADGSEIEADVVVLATGYQNMRTTTRRIFGDQLYNQTKDVWGLDEEGEIKTMWRDSGHKAFFFAGGNLALCRFLSKRLALRIKAQLLGLTP
ncbi:hypothetical protein OC846_004079 [Tilletia horrida]|uniref:FAD/NAD(P)-binding domain-containing protein n=1 Tax=Tilletia horrida TaxID=155126 RepID=A0AAN6JXB5_9BASI|nr:hypothetical protein OC846_004079 [Tilletia horrida]KAK0564567.1 hypothetical protein OC861_004214 [Tilletia horrida]